MDTDALIVGAGPVGLTMAAELTRHGLRCRIVDKEPAPSDKSKALVLWPRTLELLVSLQHPDGVEVDTTGSWYSQQFAADAGNVWPTWRATGKPLKSGSATGVIVFRVPEKSWWSEGRIAIVGLFSDPFTGKSIARQYVWQIQRDAAGPILVRDPVAAACVAGPYVPP